MTIELAFKFFDILIKNKNISECEIKENDKCYNIKMINVLEFMRTAYSSGKYPNHEAGIKKRFDYEMT